MTEFTDIEKQFLIMLMRIGREIIRSSNGYIEFDYECFNENDLFNIACKLGIENEY